MGNLYLYIIMSVFMLFSIPAYAKQVKVKGKIEVIYEENLKAHKINKKAFLKDENGKRHELKFKNKSEIDKLKTGANAEVTGNKKSDDSEELEVEFLKGGKKGNDGGGSTGGTSGNFSGERKVLLVLIDFLDQANNTDLNQFSNYMFAATQSVQSVYQDSSNNKIHFNGDLDNNGAMDYERAAINAVPGGLCSYRTWSDMAAAIVGSKISNYDHVIYSIPSGNTSCFFAGAAVAGCASGETCPVWVFSSTNVVILGHELGHNLGFGHAGLDASNDRTNVSPYGDDSDIMGNDYTPKKFNAPHMLHAGWISSNQITDLTAGTTGIYDIGAVGDHSSSLSRMVRIDRTTLDGNKEYYISYRDNGGEDMNLNSSFVGRVSIHYAHAAGAAGTTLVKTIGPGEVFVDLEQGLGVKMLSENGASAKVELFQASINDGNCYHLTPTIEFHQTKLYFAPNSTYQAVATFKNNDSYGCAPQEAKANLGLNSYLGGEVVDPNFVIGPQETREVVVNYYLDSTSLNTFGHSIILSVGLQESVLRSRTIAKAYLDLEAPVMNSVYVYESSLRLSFSATDDRGINHYEIYRDSGSGFALYTTSTSNSFQEMDIPEGATYNYYVIAVDNLGQKSNASTTVSLTGGAVLEAPVMLSPRISKNGSVSLSWTASASNISQYQLDRMDANGNIIRTLYLSGSKASYTDRDLERNTTYQFKVRYKTSEGRFSPHSNTITLTTN